MFPERRISIRSDEWRHMAANTERASTRVEQLNRLPYADQDAIRAAFSELTTKAVDPTFRLLPPF